jgi:sirohydrochlorin cobaltochelatase
MRKTALALISVLSAAMMLSSPAMAGSHGGQRPEKIGILLVAFGSSIPEAQVSFQNIEALVKQAFPEVPVRWAYTSSIIRRKLAKQGQSLDSVEMALVKMMEDGFTQVAVQSLHTIRGEEYDDLMQIAQAFENLPEGIRRIRVGAPLLSDPADMEKVAAAVIANIPAERKKSEALVLMGHGTPHPSNVFYAALMFQLQRKDPNLFVGTVEGSPDIEDIKTWLLEKKLRKAYLMPFMSVAGDHARNDMAGDEEDSWKSILTRAGITCQPVLKGTAEYDNMVAIWIDHLRAVLAHMKP